MAGAVKYNDRKKKQTTIVQERENKMNERKIIIITKLLLPIYIIRVYRLPATQDLSDVIGQHGKSAL